MIIAFKNTKQLQTFSRIRIEINKHLINKLDVQLLLSRLLFHVTSGRDGLLPPTPNLPPPPDPLLKLVRARLYQASASTLRQLWDAACDSVLIEINGVAEATEATPLSLIRTELKCHHRVVAALTLTLGVNRSLEMLTDSKCERTVRFVSQEVTFLSKPQPPKTRVPVLFIY